MRELQAIIDSAYVSEVHTRISIELSKHGSYTTEIIPLVLTGIYLFVIERGKQRCCHQLQDFEMFYGEN